MWEFLKSLFHSAFATEVELGVGGEPEPNPEPNPEPKPTCARCKELERENDVLRFHQRRLNLPPYHIKGGGPF